MKLYGNLAGLTLAVVLIFCVACDSGNKVPADQDAAYQAVRTSCKKGGATDKQCDCLVNYVMKQAKAGNRATMDVDNILQTECK